MFVPDDLMLVTYCGIAAAAIVGILTFYKWKFAYWKRRGLFYLKPSFPFGTMENPLCRTMSLGVWVRANYNKLKSMELKHAGLYNFTSPIYLPIEPDYIKNILLKDFNHFADRGTYYNEKDDPLSAHLFAMEGGKCKSLRAKLSPTFSSGKMKMIFEVMLQCSTALHEAVDELVENKERLDIKEIAARYTTDVICLVVFGLDCDSFKTPDNEFRTFGRKLFARNRFSAVKSAFLMANQEIGRKLGMRVTPKDVENFFMNLVKQSINYRETNGSSRKDILQILIDLKNRKKSSNLKDGNEGLTFNEIAAQLFGFFTAGFETSSSAMAHFIFETARNGELQEKIRAEINKVLDKYNGKITYGALMDLKYMDQVIDETLRKYSPLTVIQRRCTKQYRVPGTDVLLEKGTTVMIPVLGLHYDPEYFPDPEKFDPDRFSKENKARLHPFVHLPFGKGPRMCLGVRFGVMQTKIGLITLLKNYKFSVSNNTEIPLRVNKFSLAHKYSNVLWLNADKIK